MTTKAQARGGFCLCNRPVAEHFDESNRRVSCASLAVPSDPALESATTTVEQSAGNHDVVDKPLGYWPQSVPLPVLLTDAQLQLVLQISSSRFYQLKKLGRFRMLEAKPALVTRSRYCPRLVRDYIEGRWTFAEAFGRRTRTLLSGHEAHRGAVIPLGGSPQSVERRRCEC